MFYSPFSFFKGCFDALKGKLLSQSPSIIGVMVTVTVIEVQRFKYYLCGNLYIYASYITMSLDYTQFSFVFYRQKSAHPENKIGSINYSKTDNNPEKSIVSGVQPLSCIANRFKIVFSI